MSANPSGNSSIGRDVLIATVGIVATFIATYLGVYLATAAQQRVDTEKSIAAYKSMLGVMAVDCLQVLKLNRDLSPKDQVPQLRSPVFLYSTPLQNSLLFEHMESSKLIELIHSLTRSAFFAQKYQEFVSLSPSGILPPVIPTQGENPMQFHERIQNEVRAFGERRIAEAKDFHQKYVSETENLCRLLEAGS